MANKRQREAAKRKKDEENGAGATTKAARSVEVENVSTAAATEEAPQSATATKGAGATTKAARTVEVEKVSMAAATEEAPQSATAALKKAAPEKAVEHGGKSWTGGRDDSRGSTQQKEFEVCVNGLPFSVTKDAVWRDFSECGEIVNLHVPLDESGYLRGIAFIQYVDQESVDKALAYHDTEYGGRWIQVRLSSDKTTGKGKGKGCSRSKLLEVFVGGLANTATEDDLRKDFEECGRIVYCRVPVDDAGSARGIAFIEFADQESVDRALMFNNTEYFGRDIQVRLSNSDSKGKGKDSTCNSMRGGQEGHADSYAKTSEDTRSSGKLTEHTDICNFELEVFLHGVPPSTTLDCLREEFCQFGKIANLTLPMTPDGEARGIAFIEFKSKEACVKALTLNGTRRGGRLLNVRMSEFNGFEAREGRRHAKARG